MGGQMVLFEEGHQVAGPQLLGPGGDKADLIARAQEGGHATARDLQKRYPSLPHARTQGLGNGPGRLLYLRLPCAGSERFPCHFSAVPQMRLILTLRLD
jgi:hypothetical protein